MRKLIDQHQARMPGQRAVQVEFLQDMAAVGDFLQGQDGQAFQQAGGFAPAVGFDDAGQHVRALGGLRARGHQHGVCLAHAGGRPEIDAKLAAHRLPRGVVQGFQERVGIGTLACGVSHERNYTPRFQRPALN
ncbi:hypothetical protein D9M68_537740 [compost metagenome]